MICPNDGLLSAETKNAIIAFLYMMARRSKIHAHPKYLFETDYTRYFIMVYQPDMQIEAIDPHDHCREML